MSCNYRKASHAEHLRGVTPSFSRAIELAQGGPAFTHASVRGPAVEACFVSHRDHLIHAHALARVATIDANADVVRPPAVILVDGQAAVSLVAMLCPGSVEVELISTEAPVPAHPPNVNLPMFGVLIDVLRGIDEGAPLYCEATVCILPV